MHVHNEQHMYDVAAEFASQLRGGELVALIGDLGAGKTTFVRGVVQALGSDVRVKSPTFTVMNEYPVEGEDVQRIVHLDLYRFSDIEQVQALALADEMREDTVIFVEWPDRFEENILPFTHDVRIDHANEGREVMIEKHGA